MYTLIMYRRNELEMSMHDIQLGLEMHSNVLSDCHFVAGRLSGGNIPFQTNIIETALVLKLAEFRKYGSVQEGREAPHVSLRLNQVS